MRIGLFLIMLAVTVATFIVGRMLLRTGREQKSTPENRPADKPQEPAAQDASPRTAYVPPTADSGETWIAVDATKVRQALKARDD